MREHFTIYICTEFHVPSSIGSSVILTNPDAANLSLKFYNNKTYIKRIYRHTIIVFLDIILLPAFILNTQRIVSVFRWNLLS
jgi:hypothetical protein